MSGEMEILSTVLLDVLVQREVHDDNDVGVYCDVVSDMLRY